MYTQKCRAFNGCRTGRPTDRGRDSQLKSNLGSWCSILAGVLLAVIMAGCSQARRGALNHDVVAAPPAAQPAEVASQAPAPQSVSEWNLKRRLPPGATQIPAGLYDAAVEHFARMPKASVPEMAAQRVNGPAAAANRAWIPLGPGNIGTRTRSLLINPQDPNIMYAGAVTGGVFKSTDGGKNWAVRTDELPVINIAVNSSDWASYCQAGAPKDGHPCPPQSPLDGKAPDFLASQFPWMRDRWLGFLFFGVMFLAAFIKETLKASDVAKMGGADALDSGSTIPLPVAAAFL